MKNNFVSILVLTLLFLGCGKPQEAKQKSNSTKKSLFITNKMGYQNQLPLYTGEANATNLNVNIQNIIGQKLADESIGYSEFEKMMSPELTISEQQYLIYIILAKKDFIAYVNANKNSKQNVEKLRNYVSVLVKSKYIGYCVLYNALKVLQTIDKEFVNNNFLAIVSYAEKDGISKSMAQNTQTATGNTDQKQAIIQSKFKENLEYLDRIKLELQK